MGVDQISRHDHSSEAEGGEDIAPTSVSLPPGASIGGDNGDFVVRDSSGTVVFRRNESADEWQFENTDLTGISSLSTGDAIIKNDLSFNGESIDAIVETAEQGTRVESGAVGGGVRFLKQFDNKRFL